MVISKINLVIQFMHLYLSNTVLSEKITLRKLYAEKCSHIYAESALISA